MKKILFLVISSIVFCLISCGEKILIEDEPTIPLGSYWVDSFFGEPDQKVSIEFRVTSGGAVDVMLLPGYGFEQYKKMTTMDTFVIKSSTPVDSGSYSAIRFGNGNGIVVVDFESDLKADLLLMDESNFNNYRNGQLFSYWGVLAVTKAQGYFITNPSTIMYAVVDNTNIFTPPEGRLTYNLIVGSYPNTSCTCYVYGSCFGTLRYQANFELIDRGWYYYVVNNVIAFEGGAVPEGDVTVYMKVINK